MLHTLVQSLTTPSGQVSVSKQYSAAGSIEIDETVPATTTHMPLSLAIDVSQLKSLLISSDVALTLKTNSSGSPTDTIAIKAGIPYIWNTDSYDTCLITADVTTAFLTNATGGAATVSIRGLYDPTP